MSGFTPHERGQNVLVLLATKVDGGGATLDDLEALYGHPVAATTVTLAAHGYLHEAPNGCYQLTPKGSDFADELLDRLRR